MALTPPYYQIHGYKTEDDTELPAILHRTTDKGAHLAAYRSALGNANYLVVGRVIITDDFRQMTKPVTTAPEPTPAPVPAPAAH